MLQPQTSSRIRILIAVFGLSTALSACAEDLDGYLDSCESDEDCGDDWSCLSTGENGPEVCSRVCETDDDCPEVSRATKRACDFPIERFPCESGVCASAPCD